MVKVSRGESVNFEIDFRDRSDVLTDPDTVTITVISPSRVVAVDAVAMTNLSAGKYNYSYAVPETAQLGEWTVEYKGVSGTYSTKYRDRFAVVRQRTID